MSSSDSCRPDVWAGWTTWRAVPQGLHRLLLDRLKDKMKGTRADGTIEALFEGKVNVHPSSQREETFVDIELDVKGCGNLKASLDEYMQGHGQQDAVRSVRFTEFPPRASTSSASSSESGR
jgi:ubiquitin carboxyl-terminal hydrolase 7